MSLNKTEFSQCIWDFKFRKLFNEMGWTNDKTSQPIIVDGETFKLEAVAEKSGFKILVCSPNSEGVIPDYNTRKKIETKVTKLFQEHLIIFHDAKNSEQIWQLVVRQTGKPTKVTETRYNTNQDPELLFQRASGIFFELDEEENITIVDVTKRIAENFHQNADKVTAKFYIQFKKEHNSFSDFLTGIDDHIDEWNKTHPKQKQENLNKQWYVSLMLNRLMFCYFIQKKGFLDRNKNYLRDKLRLSQAKKGKDKFYSFYRHFLLELFHSGLGAPDHSDGLKAEIGKIPYLNGGLFDEHELEDKFKIFRLTMRRLNVFLISSINKNGISIRGRKRPEKILTRMSSVISLKNISTTAHKWARITRKKILPITSAKTVSCRFCSMKPIAIIPKPLLLILKSGKCLKTAAINIFTMPSNTALVKNCPKILKSV